MYRIAKTLNHNSFIGVEEENNREYLVMGKGIAFGKKTGQRVQPGDDARIYSLTEMTERGNARTIVQGVSPLSLELASAVLDEAEKEFGKIDRSIVFPMADHLDFAVRRIQNGEQISNPLTDDIRVMFYKEYKVASCIRELLKERLQIEIDEHEIGYLACSFGNCGGKCFTGHGSSKSSPGEHFFGGAYHRAYHRCDVVVV